MRGLKESAEKLFRRVLAADEGAIAREGRGRIAEGRGDGGGAEVDVAGDGPIAELAIASGTRAASAGGGARLVKYAASY
jgi:hypothetical protein